MRILGQVAIGILFVLLQACAVTPAEKDQPLPSVTASTETVEPCVVDGPTGVTVTGILTEGLFARRPIINNSATFKNSEQVFLLEFDPTICTHGRAENGFTGGGYKDLNRIQLDFQGEFSNLQNALGPYTGMKVRCTGRLHAPSQPGSYHAAILIRIDTERDCEPVPSGH